jgi:transcriptional antiterminator RfaH
MTAQTSYLYPSNLLGDFTSPESERRWWAVHTKPRQEKALARQLLAKQIPLYLPLVLRQSMSNGRRTSSEVPVFSSYVFVYCDAQERIQAYETKRVVQMLSSADRQAMTRDLQNIHSLLAAGAPLTVEARLQPGNRVRVKSGALMGVEGIIVSRRGENRLVVAVEFLQQGVSVVINDFQVEPL